MSNSNGHEMAVYGHVESNRKTAAYTLDLLLQADNYTFYLLSVNV
jgi:hypothetical protein